MKRQFLSSVLVISGILILAAAIFQYQNIRGAQKEMLAVYEQSNADEIPVVFQPKVDQNVEAATPLQLESKEMAITKREDYQSGQLTITIPKLERNAAVVKGTTIELLKKGPGLYESSPLPDSVDGNVCIAGHRTTYGAWFRYVDMLKKGDEIILNYNGASYTYLVEKVFITDKKDWSITAPQGYSAITLTSCHPLRSSKQRIVVRAELVE
jgi:LPXTG-site transpeptidase (sortase) family protein